MSSLFYSPRHHPRSYGNYHRGQLSPYARSGFSASPFGWGVEPFSFNEPFHAPFQSLFNDTFSQLERLTNEMNTHLNGAFSEGEQGQSTWQKLLTSTPKFDVKETEDAYLLEGELPGVAKKDISLDFIDDNTLVLKTKTETIREEKPAPQAEQKQVEGAADTQMSGANPDAEGPEAAKSTEAQDKDKQVTTTNQNKDVAQAGPQPTYHLTERTYGSFQRAFSFPSEVKHEEVKAKLANGVLTMTIPKVQKTAEPEKKSRTVTVEDAEEGVEAEKEEKSKL